MLEEQRKLKQPGRKEDILFFLQDVIGKRQISEKDIIIICNHSPGQHQLDVDALLSYCRYLNLVDCREIVMLNSDVACYLDDADQLNDYIIRKTLSILFESQILEVDMFIYDSFFKRFTFKNEKLPLTYAAIRNTLLNQGYFEINRSSLKTEFYIANQYVELTSSYCRANRRTLELEQLKKRLEANNLAGEKAEIHALQFEKKRLETHMQVESVRIISQIDVCAGYDIISFDTCESTEHDRFIEVKAVANYTGFYWSANELQIAKLKGKQYYLYLVDLQKVSEENYTPMIINDPANELFTSDEWLIEPQSFHIRHI